jgi:hypothetical protein
MKPRRTAWLEHTGKNWRLLRDLHRRRVEELQPSRLQKSVPAEARSSAQ